MSQGYTLEEITVGQSVEVTKVVSTEDVQAFADLTGDHNPVHLDAEFAATTQFEKPIAHGMLGAGLISAAIASELPGPGSIYLEQALKFRAPVFVGAEVVTRITVLEKDERRRRVTLKTECLCGDTVVIKGEASIMIPKA